jgi:predicted Zn-dependent peptidase
MYKKATLDNGITVVTESMPHVRSVSLGVWVNVGSRHEDPALKGISHFIEHMLFKGTKKRSAKDIAIEIDSIGGEMNAFTSKESTTYYIKALDRHLPLAVDILSDIFFNSVYDPKEVERERKVIIEEIKMVDDTPDDLVHELYFKTVWKDHPLGIPVLGSKRSINSITREMLMGYMSSHYLPASIVISAAGHLNMDELLDLLNTSFGSRKRRGKTDGIAIPKFRSAVNVMEQKLEQAHLCMGYEGLPYASGDRYGIYVLNSILGSSMSSRLFQEVREKRGLAYSVFSYLTQLRDAGLFTIYAAVSPSKAVTLLKVINREIRKLIRNGIDDDELVKVKEQMKGNIVLGLENTNNRMSQLAKHEIYLGRYLNLDEILDDIDRVDMEQVQRLIKDIFEDGRPSLAALGPVDRQAVKAAFTG